MRRFLIYGALVFLGFQTGLAAASERGTTSADFLKIGMGATAAGMGEAYTARSGDVNAMFYNPAGLTGMEMSRLAATHLNWIAETQYEAITFAHPVVGVGTLGFGLFLLHMPEIPALDINNTDTGMIQAYDLGVQFAYARNVSPWVGLDGLEAGANLKFLHRELAGLGASGAAVDLGALYHLDKNTTLGFSLSNLGYFSSFESQSEQLPIVIRLGAGYHMQLAENQQLQVMVDLVEPLDNTLRANVGLEYVVANIVSLRAGYKLGYDTDGFQAGAGVQWHNMSVDYALKVMDVFGMTHFITASVGFGTPVKAIMQSEVKSILQTAEEYYSQGKYPEALQTVEKAIVVDGQDKRALELRDKLRTVLQMLEMPTTGEQKQNTGATSNEGKDLTPDEKEELEQPVNQEVIP